MNLVQYRLIRSHCIYIYMCFLSYLYIPVYRSFLTSTGLFSLIFWCFFFRCVRNIYEKRPDESCHQVSFHIYLCTFFHSCMSLFWRVLHVTHGLAYHPPTISFHQVSFHICIYVSVHMCIRLFWRVLHVTHGHTYRPPTIVSFHIYIYVSFQMCVSPLWYVLHVTHGHACRLQAVSAHSDFSYEYTRLFSYVYIGLFRRALHVTHGHTCRPPGIS